MSWNMSTGLKKAMLGSEMNVKTKVLASTISTGDGDGAVISGADTINDTGSGLAGFLERAFVHIVSGDTNDNKLVQVLDSSAGKLEVPSGSLDAVAAGSALALIEPELSGSVASLFTNGVIEIYSGSRPANADTTEVAAGTLLMTITLNAGTFSAGDATNGLNMGVFDGTTMKRALDALTSVSEVWKGTGVADNTATWARWYANDMTQGASTSAIRMDGIVATSGGDLNMTNGTTVSTGVDSEVTNVSLTMSSV